MTIPFRIIGKENKPDEKLEKEFVEEGDKRYELRELKGHRSVGGIRSAIFNAISYEEIQTLVMFMNEFREKHQQKQ
jgi:phosphoserine aminotransferase